MLKMNIPIASMKIVIFELRVMVDVQIATWLMQSSDQHREEIAVASCNREDMRMCARGRRED